MACVHFVRWGVQQMLPYACVPSTLSLHPGAVIVGVHYHLYSKCLAESSAAGYEEHTRILTNLKVDPAPEAVTPAQEV